MSRPFQDYEIHLNDYLYVLRKRRMTLLIFLTLLVGASIFFTYTEQVLYRGTATMLIERGNPNVVDFKEVMSFDSSASDYYQTQYQMFKSRSLIEALVKQEDLKNDAYVHKLAKGRIRFFLRQFDFLSPWLGEFLTEMDPEDVVIRKMLKVEPVRNSRLVEVSVLHPDPKRSAEITNALADLFIQRNLEDRFTISHQATELISKQLVELKDKVAAADKALQKYKEDNDLVNIPSIRGKNDFLQEAKIELVKIQAEEAKLAKRYLPEHPKMIHLRSQIDGLQGKIDEEEKKILGLGRVAIEYGQLEREADSSRQIYEALLNRLHQTSSEAQTQASSMVIVDRAKPPGRPYKPQPFVNLLIGFFIGTIGGVILAFFLEYLDSSLSTPDDIEKGLGLELYGIIPESEMNKDMPFQGQLFGGGTGHSPAAESIRALRTALLFHLRHTSGCRSLLITSPNPGEGKSTIAFNLATAFQQNHLKVLLIDTDLRKPRLHKILNLTPSKGLTDVLEGRASFEESVIANVPGLGFDFLSSGTHSSCPAEILGSVKLKELLSQLGKSYDVILLDSPPYLAVADVAILNELAAGVVVVVRYHNTDKRHIRDLNRRFNILEGKGLGVVMNRVSVREKDYYYHQYYYYGYGDAAPGK
jgi:capsular exopolysaccharide synthesis family protein